MDKIGLNGSAVHALWTLHGLAAISGNVVSAVVDAHMHPASGVRKAALAVLPRTASSLVAIWQAGLLGDADLNVRLAAFLAVSEMPQGDSTGAELFRQSKRPEVVHDVWLPEALFIAAARHRDGFLDAFAADIGALEFTRLIGRLAAAGHATERIDWSASDLDSAWPKMPSCLWGAPAGHFRGNFQDCRSLTDLGECTQNLVSMPQSACTCVE